MGLKTILTVLLVFGGVASSLAQAAKGPRCVIGDVEQRKLLAMSFRDFDQRTDSGWRPFFEAGCVEASAEIVEAYIDRYPDRAAAHPVLHFHAGQVRAFLGETQAAVAHMERAIEANDAAERGHGADWSRYVAATVAFLRGDRAALDSARDALSGDADWSSGRQSASGSPPGADSKNSRWAPPPPPPTRDRRRGTPPSQFLPQVEGMLACFGEAYATAYGRCIAQ